MSKLFVIFHVIFFLQAIVVILDDTNLLSKYGAGLYNDAWMSLNWKIANQTTNIILFETMKGKFQNVRRLAVTSFQRSFSY